MSTDHPSVLIVHRLRKAYGGLIALDDVTVSFPQSGIVGIIGPNGAGKTTLLNVVTGFERAEEGEVMFRRRSITRSAPYDIARHGLARTFQEIRLIRSISVVDNLLLAASASRSSVRAALRRVRGRRENTALETGRHRALTLADQVGLSTKIDDLAGSLSYGQQKTLEVICALMREPRVLFLDEPVSGVFAATRRTILSQMEQHARRGNLVVFIEHDLEAVRSISEWALLFASGRLVAHGSTDEVLDNPRLLDSYLG